MYKYRVLVLLVAANSEPCHIFSSFLCTSFCFIQFVRDDFLCISFFDILFAVHNFPGIMIFDVLCYFLDFLGICIFDKTVKLQDFPDTLLFYMQYLCSIFHIFFFYILFYKFFLIIKSLIHCLSFLFRTLIIFLKNFWRFKSLCYFADNRLFFNKYFMTLLALTVHWAFYKLQLKVQSHRVSIVKNYLV